MDHARVKAVFLEALDRPPEAWAAFLDDACAGDLALRAEVASLLAHHSDAPLIEERPASTPPPADDPLGLCGVTLDDRYRIDTFVAEGGFGFVYRAWHVRWSRPVAVKVFKPLGGPGEQGELKAAFVKEGALLNDLSRKTTAIVQSYDVGTWIRPDGVPVLFTVLEWLEGRSLAESIDGEPWPLARVLATLRPVADALAVAHQSGVAHRDVKPRNIYLVDEPEGPPTVKLLDFGVAKVAAERGRGFLSTGGRITAFTVDYGAPEQISRTHGPTGPWTDVYALALLCVELLAGRHPFAGLDVIEAMGRARDPARRPTPASLGVAVSAAVEAVFARALSVERADRYADTGELWRALAAAAESPAAAAAAPRWPRAAALAAGVGAAGAAAWWLLR